MASGGPIPVVRGVPALRTSKAERPASPWRGKITLASRTHGAYTEGTMTLTEAADRLGLASSTLRHQARKGKLKVRRMGGRLYVSEAEVARYRATHKQGESDGTTNV